MCYFIFLFSKNLFVPCTEKLTTKNLQTMWLVEMQIPDFHIINEFRNKRLKIMMDKFFETLMLKLIEENYILMENYFLDGT